MDYSVILFYGLSLIVLFFALAVIISPNPVYSAFYLAITMVSLAFIYFLLQAFFIAGVQLIVYAGAVMVLFVMVLMMFDLKKETNSFSGGKMSRYLKYAFVGWFWGLLAGAIYMSSDLLSVGAASHNKDGVGTTTKDLAVLLYTDYIFAFELLGLLLLMIAVGAVAVSRIKGGTHA